MQDQWERLRRRTEKQLVDCSTKLNPLYDMQNLRKDHKMARTRDYIKEESDARLRVQLVQKKGMEYRVEQYKEELRSYEYMVAKGKIPEAKTKEDITEALKKFQSMTSKHPERSVAAAVARIAAEEKRALAAKIKAAEE